MNTITYYGICSLKFTTSGLSFSLRDCMMLYKLVGAYMLLITTVLRLYLIIYFLIKKPLTGHICRQFCLKIDLPTELLSSSIGTSLLDMPRAP